VAMLYFLDAPSPTLDFQILGAALMLMPQKYAVTSSTKEHGTGVNLTPTPTPLQTTTEVQVIL